MTDIKKLVDQNFDQMVAWRRHFHENPELSSQEFNTLAYIEKELDGFGIPWKEIPDAGILGGIDSGKPGKTVLLRADLDALPIEEDPNNLSKPRICISRKKLRSS